MAENSADLESEGIKVSGSKNRKNVGDCTIFDL